MIERERHALMLQKAWPVLLQRREQHLVDAVPSKGDGLLRHGRTQPPFVLRCRDRRRQEDDEKETGSGRREDGQHLLEARPEREAVDHEEAGEEFERLRDSAQPGQALRSPGSACVERHELDPRPRCLWTARLPPAMRTRSEDQKRDGHHGLRNDVDRRSTTMLVPAAVVCCGRVEAITAHVDVGAASESDG